MEEKYAGIYEKLRFIFPEKDKAYRILEEIKILIEDYKKEFRNDLVEEKWIDEKDAYLITYGDSLIKNGEKPLKTLNKFSKKYLQGIINNIHILPFYPWSSDDGFSVKDYYQIDSELGKWEDIKNLSKDFKMMFDAVINHISSESEWFKKYLNGEKEYKDYFIEEEWSEKIKNITRPRTHPVLTEFDTKLGKKKLWTTFSEDQIDLNFKSEKLFIEIIRVLLFYAKMGSVSIRLDAIGYMWKKLGTSCIHLAETHAVIKIWRDIFEMVEPRTILISETNVPHKDNISYFGNGNDEVKMVYQFPLPPLTVHTIQTGNAKAILSWINNLEKVSDNTTFFNFLSSHDGIGVVPAKGLLSKKEVNKMIEKVKEFGGLVSYKTNSDGSQSPYEMNINFLEALSHPNEDDDMRVKKFISAQVILLSVMGVPAIYIHSLLGSLNDFKGIEKTGRNRSINREKLVYDIIVEELNDDNSLRSKVYTKLKKLLEIRKEEKLFNPINDQVVIKVDDKIFAIRRVDVKGNSIAILNNVSPETVKINKSIIGNGKMIDIITGNQVGEEIELKPYEYMWVK